MDLQVYNVWIDIVRVIFNGLDGIIYGLIKWLLFGIFDLAHLTTSADVFNGIYSRIYVILGIFMAFKLSFSFFQYIIDPESMTGKSDKSITKVISRMFIMLVTLIFLPPILFGTKDGPGLLSRAQDAFLPSLPKIIFGVTDINGLNSDAVSYSSSSSTDDFTKSIEQSSEAIAVNTLRGFYAPVPELNIACGNGTYEKTPQIRNLKEFANTIHSTCKVGYGLFSKEFWTLPAWEVIQGKQYYLYSYNYGISTVVGVLVLLLLAGITIDIAKRVFKLIVLEAIAPIPIMSLVDPKASKDGAFGKWVKSLTTTFLDIFLKLGLVYLIVVLIQMITAKGSLFSNFPENAGFRTTYLTVLLILGLIFFAKEAPKFIKDALGIKDSGGGLFDDVKTIGKAAGLVGGAAVGAAGVVGSTVGSVRAQHQANKAENEDLGGKKNVGHSLLHGARNVGAALSGAVGGTAAGVKGLTGKNAGIASVMKAQQDRNAADFARRREGGTFFGGVGSGVRQAFTGESGYDAYERETKKMEENVKKAEVALKPRQDTNAYRKAIMDRVKSKAAESDKTTGTYGGITGNYREYSSAYAAAQAGAGRFKKYVDSSGNTVSEAFYRKLTESQRAQYQEHEYFSFNGQDVDMAKAQSIGMGLLDENQIDYYNKAYSTKDDATKFDSTIAEAIDDYNRDIEEYNKEAVLKGKELIPEMESTLGAVKTSFGKNDREIKNEASRINKEKQAIYDRQQSFKAQRKKANANRYSAKKGK